ncbi:hypothetical protein [Burkholderia thailandensis]|uniref:hypothetical protein n=1 Tax=Burkholderia thailandensis TaxID=57975 RepID=UPI00016A579B|nr:hypothetical protein [Burkholderia thailandensis]AHI67060.1 hypothetical protein BTL_4469 [Burkholderia thailandensis H0587]AHI76575.1 hypothetical protein BTQ_4995 [Burkholderia thailandensis 2002721723]AHI82327.1 hypothetical protein BTJ_3622 [Burkholderia thailandensis E444]AIC90195.1 hypothetical protein BTRA_3974 [Burkholderia thailandensis USAMRU Malaysia \
MATRKTAGGAAKKTAAKKVASKTAAKKSAAKAAAAPQGHMLSVHLDAGLGELPGKVKLPSGTVKPGKDDGIVIDVQKLAKQLIRDQRSRLVSSMGCISNPGGPGC